MLQFPFALLTTAMLVLSVTQIQASPMSCQLVFSQQTVMPLKKFLQKSLENHDIQGTIIWNLDTVDLDLAEEKEFFETAFQSLEVDEVFFDKEENSYFIEVRGASSGLKLLENRAKEWGVLRDIEIDAHLVPHIDKGPRLPSLKNESLSFDAISRILTYLRKKSRLKGTEVRNKVERAFLDLKSHYWGPENKNDYIKLVQEIQFKPGDIQQISTKNPSKATVARLVRGWRLFLQLTGEPDWESTPITEETVEAHMANLEGRDPLNLQVSEASSSSTLANSSVQNTKRTYIISKKEAVYELSQEANNQLATIGLNLESLKQLVDKWDGIWLSGYNDQVPENMMWTLMFEMPDGETYHRDRGYLVYARQLGEGRVLIEGISSPERENEVSYYKYAAQQMGFQAEVKIQPGQADLPELIYLNSSNQAKVKLKHRIDIQKLENILKEGRVIHHRFDQGVIIKRIEDPEDSRIVYQVVYQAVDEEKAHFVTAFRSIVR